MIVSDKFYRVSISNNHVKYRSTPVAGNSVVYLSPFRQVRTAFERYLKKKKRTEVCSELRRNHANAEKRFSEEVGI